MSHSTPFIESLIAKKLARTLLGAIFVVFGLNGFFNFIPMPPLPEVAGQFLGGLGSSGYFFPFLKTTEILVGLLLLANILTPLALTILAPITLNIVAFHAFLAPAGMALPILILVLNVYLAWVYRAYYRQLLTIRV